MVTINLYSGRTGSNKIFDIEIKINTSSFSDIYNNFHLIDFGEFEMGNDSDDTENLTAPANWKFSFRTNPDDSATFRKLLNLLCLNTSDVTVWHDTAGVRKSVVFFIGTVDPANVEADVPDRLFNIQVDDAFLKWKDDDISGNPYGFEVLNEVSPSEYEPLDFTDLKVGCYPLLYHIDKILNKNSTLTPIYDNYIIDSELQGQFNVSGTDYIATLAGYDNFGTSPVNKAYLSLWNGVFQTPFFTDMPKTSATIIRAIGDLFGCTLTPGFNKKFYILQRWETPGHTVVNLTDSNIIEVVSTRVIYPKMGAKLEYWLPRYSPGAEIFKGYAEDGSLLNEEKIENLIMKIGREHYVETAPDPDAYYAGIVAGYGRAGYWASGGRWEWDVRFNIVRSVTQDRFRIGSSGSWGNFAQLVFAKVADVVQTVRFNFVIKVAGTDWKFEDYYTHSFDYPAGTYKYKCRKMKINFDENWTELDLVSW